jgi:hypothetical protein
MLQARKYLLAACSNVENVQNGTDEQKALAAGALAEALTVIETLERGENFLANGDEAYAAQAGLGNDATALDALNAAVQQQEAALEVLEAIALYGNAEDAEHLAQARTTLAAARERFESAENAYQEQVTLIEKTQQLAAATERQQKAQEVWDEIMQSNGNQTELDVTKRGATDDRIKQARQELLDANEALIQAQNAFDQQEQALADANAELAVKESTMAAIAPTNEAIAERDAIRDGLAEATAQRNALNDELTAASNRTAAAMQDLQTAVNAAAALIEQNGQSLLRANALRALPAAAQNGALTNSTDSVDAITAELAARLEAQNVLSDDIQNALTTVSEKLAAYYDARTDEAEVQRERDEAQSQVESLSSALPGAQTAVNDAKNTQAQVISTNGAPADNSGVTTQALPTADDTANNSNLNVSGNAVIRTGGDFGTTDNAMSAEIGGTLDLTSGGEIGVHSGKDLDIVQAKGNGDVDLSANGSIRNASGNNGTMISGEKVTLNAITGSEGNGSDLGSKDKPLNINATGFGAKADNMYVNNANKGNTVLDNVTAQGNAALSFGGSVTQEPGAVAAADTMTLKAGGAIGTAMDGEPTYEYTDGIETPTGIEKPEGSLTINAGKLNVSGSEVHVYSIAPETVLDASGRDGIEVTAVGNLMPGKNVQSGNPVALYALGNVGTPNNGFVVSLGSKFTVDSIYGMANVRPQQLVYIYNEVGGALGLLNLTDVLVITDIRLSTGNAADELLSRALASSGKIMARSVGIFNSNGNITYRGNMNPVLLILKLAEGEPMLENGQTVYILHSRDGEFELLKGIYWEGYVIFFTDGLATQENSNFVVVTEEALAELGLTPEDAAQDHLSKLLLGRNVAELVEKRSDYVAEFLELIVKAAEESTEA